MSDNVTANAACIDTEIAWFRAVLEMRFKDHASDWAGDRDPQEIPPPRLPAGAVPYAAFAREHGLDPAERLILALAFLPHIRPEELDPFLVQNEALQRRFTEFGGVVGAAHTGFLPTAETALFLLAGGSTGRRLEHLGRFRSDARLYRSHILQPDSEGRDEPSRSSPLRLTPEALETLTTGETHGPSFGAEFPAQRIVTTQEWRDLVVDPEALQEIDDILAWVRHRNTLLDDWNLGRRIKPGFRTLFYGPPGTGKSLTAALLGKATGMPVYRIDLSKLFSKYIGETEKNLARLFDRAEDQDWILFFDEADSIFGKRTEARTSNDRAANQQISYLLQRVEEYSGVVILASNLRAQIDEAFARRFQSMIAFSMPQFEQRLRLWEESFLDKPYRLAPDVSLKAIARDHELSGGSIVNALRYACLRAVSRGSQEVQGSDLLQAIRKERHKEGRFLAETHR